MITILYCMIYARSNLLQLGHRYIRKRKGRSDPRIWKDRRNFIRSVANSLLRKFLLSCERYQRTGIGLMLQRVYKWKRSWRGRFRGCCFPEQRRNNETKIETAAGEWAGVFSRRNFYSVLSVHVYGIYFVVTGPGYCVLGARAGIIPDTSDGDVWAARYEMVRWASVGLYYLCPT